MPCPGDCFEEKISKEQLANRVNCSDEWICSICFQVVGCTPKLTECSHLFCGDCLEEWFAAQPNTQSWAQRAKTAGRVPCPVCATPLQKSEDVHLVAKTGVRAVLWRMLSSLKVRCSQPHGTGYCTWAGTYRDYWDHVHGGTCGQGVGENVEELGDAIVTSSGLPAPACINKGEVRESDTASLCKLGLKTGDDIGEGQAVGSFKASSVATPSEALSDAPTALNSSRSLDSCQRHLDSELDEQSVDGGPSLQSLALDANDDLQPSFQTPADIKAQHHKQSDYIHNAFLPLKSQGCQKRCIGKKRGPSQRRTPPATPVDVALAEAARAPAYHAQMMHWLWQCHAARVQNMQYQAAAYQYQCAQMTAMAQAGYTGLPVAGRPASK
eukprot:TRINITY_DN87548_c0_g1_i1.p1 TRINITY_DN87548_c0_g1~~TRINITY_DN87548_c0_g1_i1.p1  ORF type:complete len:408 (-),score=58.92 TRINITY_DN87548_c0_g1_i1:329-1474(-)